MKLSVADIDFRQLSSQERWTLEHVIPLVQDGFPYKQIARQLDGDAKTLEADVDHLGAKLMALAGTIELPPLSDDELQALRDSIAEHGQWMPILRGSPTSGLPGEIIDGHNRRRICAELQIEPKIIDVDGTADQLHALGLVLNLARRHMSTSSRRGIVRAQLLATPEQSDRSIGASVGVSHPTVAAVRRELEQTGGLEKLSSRVGRNGVQKPASPARAPQGPPEKRSVRVLVPAEMFEQWVGGWVTCRAFRLIERRPGVHELEVQILDPVAASADQVEQLEVRIVALAEKGNHGRDEVVRELLQVASSVFAREISSLGEFTAEEAEWLAQRLEGMNVQEAAAST